MPWRSRAYCRFAAENPCVGGSIPPLATNHLTNCCGATRTISPCVADPIAMRSSILRHAAVRPYLKASRSGVTPGLRLAHRLTTIVTFVARYLLETRLRTCLEAILDKVTL